MKSPKVWVIDILQAVEKIEKILDGCTYEHFEKDDKTNLAVTKLVENIGEACNHLHDDFHKSYPEIPWRQIIAMRNRLVHDYWDIDLEMLWVVATQEVYELKNSLAPLVDELP